MDWLHIALLVFIAWLALGGAGAVFAINAQIQLLGKLPPDHPDRTDVKFYLHAGPIGLVLGWLEWRAAALER